MKSKITIIFLFSVVSLLQATDTLWTKMFGEYNRDVRGYSIQQTLNGGYIVAGINQPFFPFDPYYIYVVKTDSAGNVEWENNYAGIRGSGASCIRCTSDSAYIITGWTALSGSPALCLFKINSLGDSIWARVYGDTGGSILGYSVQQTQDKGYIAVGRIGSHITYHSDIYFIKTDSLGDTLWTRRYGDTLDDVGYSVEQTRDGGYIIAGQTISFGTQNIWLIKTDSLGDTLWTRTIGGTYGRDVKQTNDNGFIVTGSSTGALNELYLVKTDSMGNIMWTKNYGGDGNDFGNAVELTLDGGYIVTGFSSTFGGGEDDVYIIKTNAQGDTFWTKHYGYSHMDQGYAVVQTADSGYAVAGYTEQTNGDCVWLLKLGSDFTVEENPPGRQSYGTLPMLHVSPNPFSSHGGTYIRFSNVVDNANIRIFDILGRMVRLFEISKHEGTIFWRGEDDAGDLLPPGMYLLRLTSSNIVIQAKPVVLLR